METMHTPYLNRMMNIKLCKETILISTSYHSTLCYTHCFLVEIQQLMGILEVLGDVSISQCFLLERKRDFAEGEGKKSGR